MKSPVRLLTLIPLVALMACAGGGGSEGEDALAALLLSGSQTPTAEAGDAPVPVPPGLPAPPGAPQNAPVLLAPTINTANQGARDARVTVTDINFAQPVHGETVVMTFLGGPTMALQPNATVVNSIMHWERKASQLDNLPEFVGRGSDFGDKRIRALVVARNEFGLSSIEAPVRHARECAGAATVPVTIGDCGDYCATVSEINPGTLRFITRKMVPAATVNMLELYFTSFTPTGGFAFDSAGMEFSDPPDYDPIAAGAYEVSADFNYAMTPHMCIDILSESFAGFTNGVVYRALDRTILVP